MCVYLYNIVCSAREAKAQTETVTARRVPSRTLAARWRRCGRSSSASRAGTPSEPGGSDPSQTLGGPAPAAGQGSVAAAAAAASPGCQSELTREAWGRRLRGPIDFCRRARTDGC